MRLINLLEADRETVMKPCKDCIYYEDDGTCHYKTAETNPVTGKKFYPSCIIERLENWPFDILFNRCSKRGRWWVKA